MPPATSAKVADSFKRQSEWMPPATAAKVAASFKRQSEWMLPVNFAKIAASLNFHLEIVHCKDLQVFLSLTLFDKLCP